MPLGAPEDKLRFYLSLSPPASSRVACRAYIKTSKSKSRSRSEMKYYAYHALRFVSEFTRYGVPNVPSPPTGDVDPV